MPFFFLPFYFALENVGAEYYHLDSRLIGIFLWFVEVLLKKTVIPIALGAGLGYVARLLLNFSRQHNLIDKESFLAYSLAFCILVAGLTEVLLKGNDLLAVFAGGIVLSWNDWFVEEIREERVEEVLDLLLSLIFFVIFGASIPWDYYISSTAGTIPTMVLLVSILLLARRLPVVFFLQKFIPAVKSNREALFIGWFWPIGVGSLFWAQTFVKILCSDGASGQAESLLAKTYASVIYFAVLISVLIHGITIPLFNLTLRATMSITSVSFMEDLMPFLPTQSPSSSINYEFSSPEKDEQFMAMSEVGITFLDYRESNNKS